MKSNHIKTTWVDNKTPVNAANLNKLESAVSDIYRRALDPHDIHPGEGVEINTTSKGGIEISIDGGILSENITRMSIDTEAPSDDSTEEQGRLRIVLGADLNLDNIYYGGVAILSEEGLVYQSDLTEINSVLQDFETNVNDVVETQTETTTDLVALKEEVATLSATIATLQAEIEALKE